jgi:3,4-dihydroxy 2-butanone 4-phosphate synthase/GTP cyclohydrolase II
MELSRTTRLAPIEDIIADVRAGKFVVIVDDEGRENEGDLIIAAERADAAAINFMAKHGRGLICLPLTRQRVEELELPLMAPRNLSRHQTAFTVSIEAREGVTTGISAADRARTVAVAIGAGNAKTGKDDIHSPGHVFPLVASDGGVLVRAGHTEAAVDLARLAGFKPAGVLCEIMNDDGTMARLPQLLDFAARHGLKVGSIADLIAYRRRHDTIVRRAMESELVSRYGGPFRMVVYVNTVEYAEHLALVKGDIRAPGKGPVLVRMHGVNVLSDLLGTEGPRDVLLHEAMRIIGEEGRGVVVLIREPRATSLTDGLRAKRGDRPEPHELREYGIGAQILLDLGVHEMVLLSNSHRTPVGLDGYGLTIVGERAIYVAQDARGAVAQDARGAVSQNARNAKGTRA